MAAWPDLDELKQYLNVPSDEWDGTAGATHFTRTLSAAITRIKLEVAGTAEAYDDLYEEPTEAHAQAALRMAELIAMRPDVSPSVRQDPTLRRLLYGQRRVFGVA